MKWGMFFKCISVYKGLVSHPARESGSLDGTGYGLLMYSYKIGTHCQ